MGQDPQTGCHQEQAQSACVGARDEAGRSPFTKTNGEVSARFLALHCRGAGSAKPSVVGSQGGKRLPCPLLRGTAPIPAAFSPCPPISASAPVAWRFQGLTCVPPASKGVALGLLRLPHMLDANFGFPVSTSGLNATEPLRDMAAVCRGVEAGDCGLLAPLMDRLEPEGTCC